MADPVIILDHGPLADHWDDYQTRFGELSLHLHKTDVAVMRRLDRLIAACVERGSSMTRDELAETGYQHPLEGQFY